MGHDLIKCPRCEAWVMEGHNDWHCKCGWKYVYKPPKVGSPYDTSWSRPVRKKKRAIPGHPYDLSKRRGYE